MGCFDECIGSMMEPYGGNTPLFGGNTTDATVTIVQEAYDDGMKVTRIQTPPRTDSSVLMEAINNILGLMDYTCPTLDKNGQKSSNASNEKQENGGDENDHVQSEPESKDKPESDSRPFGQDKQSWFRQDNKQEGMVDKD